MVGPRTLGRLPGYGVGLLGTFFGAVLALGSRPLEIRLPKDPCIELRALAKSLGREPNSLAAELLAAAVIDAKSYLNETAVE